MGESNSSLTTVQIGKSTYSNSTDGTSSNLLFFILLRKKIGDIMVQLLRLLTPVLNKFIGEEDVSEDSGLYNIQLEDNQSHGGNNGILILEEQGSRKWCIKCN